MECAKKSWCLDKMYWCIYVRPLVEFKDEFRWVKRQCKRKYRYLAADLACVIAPMTLVTGRTRLGHSQYSDFLGDLNFIINLLRPRLREFKKRSPLTYEYARIVLKVIRKVLNTKKIDDIYAFRDCVNAYLSLMFWISKDSIADFSERYITWFI